MWLCRRGSDAAEMESSIQPNTMCGAVGGYVAVDPYIWSFRVSFRVLDFAAL